MKNARAVSAVWLLLLLSSFCQGAQLEKNGNGVDAPRSSRHIAEAAKGFSFKKSLDTYSNAAKQLQDCNLDPALLAEIQGYRDVAEQIIEAIVNGSFKGATYKELADLVDRYPIRQSGFKNLEDSIDYMMGRMTALGLENVRGEQVLVPHWVRGEESAEMLEPHKKTLRLLGLGTTVGTGAEGLTGEVLVVKSFADLDAKQNQVPGKIVVFNQGWLETYGATNVYRTSGASRASNYGAIASLIQSVAPFSLDTPHTGSQTYWANVTHIPTACITGEDADFMARLQDRGERIMVHIKLLDYNLPKTTSRNVIGEIGGTGKPEELVAVTGHIDSWDLGQGAMDDGGGVMISVMALAALKNLSLTPARKLQAILWTSEEVGLWGVEDFANQHADILEKYSVVFESDSGTFKPRGLDFAGSVEAGCIVSEVLKLTSSINTTTYARYPTVSSDITKLIAKGVPGLSLNTENDEYFWYHHTDADTITMMDSVELDLNTALWAVTSYVLADLSEKLPRDPPAP